MPSPSRTNEHLAAPYIAAKRSMSASASPVTAARVDDDELHPALLCRLDLGPEMDVGGDEVGAPGDDQIGLVDRLRVGAADGADRHVPRLLAAGVAHRAGDEAAGAERVEEAEQEATVHLALMRA